MLDWIDRLFVLGITETFVIIGAICVLVDYLFPTDWRAHVGYVLFALGTFFAADLAGFSPLSSALVGSCTWLFFAFLHRTLLGELLENAPDSRSGDGQESPTDG